MRGRAPSSSSAAPGSGSRASDGGDADPDRHQLLSQVRGFRRPFSAAISSNPRGSRSAGAAAWRLVAELIDDRRASRHSGRRPVSPSSRRSTMSQGCLLYRGSCPTRSPAYRLAPSISLAGSVPRLIAAAKARRATSLAIRQRIGEPEFGEDYHRSGPCFAF